MSVSCVSNLSALPRDIPVRGRSTLSFDVEVDDDVSEFDVEYVIVSGKDWVRFTGGAEFESVHVVKSSAMFTVRHTAEFVCRKPNQAVPAFVAFTVEARVIVGNAVVCIPPSHPAIRVTSWSCDSGAGASGLNKAMLGKVMAATTVVVEIAEALEPDDSREGGDE